MPCSPYINTVWAFSMANLKKKNAFNSRLMSWLQIGNKYQRSTLGHEKCLNIAKISLSQIVDVFWQQSTLGIMFGPLPLVF